MPPESRIVSRSPSLNCLNGLCQQNQQLSTPRTRSCCDSSNFCRDNNQEMYLTVNNNRHSKLRKTSAYFAKKLSTTNYYQSSNNGLYKNTQI